MVSCDEFRCIIRVKKTRRRDAEPCGYIRIVPYHVRITTNTGSSDETKLDLTAGELETRVLGPYRAGSALTLGGRNFPIDSIDRIRINYTDDPSAEIRPSVKAERERRSRESRVVTFGGPSLDWYVADSGRDVTDEMITAPPGSATVSLPEPRDVALDPRSVMVVHGRNMAARDAMFSFLEALDLHPLDWTELRSMTGAASPYIGDILDQAFRKAQAFVVLFTGDDEARLIPALQKPGDPAHETDLTAQARPNVLFEAGMAMGRHADRTVLVEIGAIN